MDGHGKDASTQPSSTRAAFKNPFGSLRHRPPKEVPAKVVPVPVKAVPVPTGTVASRISYLQSLASGTSRKSTAAVKPNNTDRSKPSLKQSPNVDTDRGGPGRQASTRFGHTQRNDDSNEDPPESPPPTQRILGWQVKRTKNDDSEDKSIKSNSSSKKGFRAKVKDVFAYGERQGSPEIVTVNTRAVSISVNKGKDSRKDLSRETESSEAKPVYPPSSTAIGPTRRLTTVHAPQPAALAKVASRDFAEEALISGRKVHNWLTGNGRGSVDSIGISVKTTSTGRVRSVQQMYSAYGIPEPSELFSKALPPPSRVVGREPRRCHVCKWINVGVERCTCCGHRICAECTIETEPISKATVAAIAAAETARLLLDTDDEIEFEEDEEETYSKYSISQLPRNVNVKFKEENWDQATVTARKRSSRQSPLSTKRPPQVGIFQERFDLPQKNPSVVAHPHTSGDGTSPPPLMRVITPRAMEDSDALNQPPREQRESLSRSPSIPPEVILEYARTLSPPRIRRSDIVKGHRKSIVKDSPFLIADQNAGNRTIKRMKRVTHKGASHVHPVASAYPPSDSSLAITSYHETSSQQSNTLVPIISPTSPKDVVKTLQMSPLMPKPLSPVKRKTDTDETKASQSVVSPPAVPSILSWYTVKENAVEKPKVPSVDSAKTPGRASPFSKAVVSVLATKTELSSPMGSDGQDDEHRAASKTPQQNLYPHGSTRSARKQRRSHVSSSGSYSPMITSTGQIITIYQTSINEHPPNSKRGRRAQGRSSHGPSHQAPSSDTPHPTRSSAERSHEETVVRKHKVQFRRRGLQSSKSHSSDTFAFCPPNPHTHIIEHSTEYIECHPEAQAATNTADIPEKMALKHTRRKQRHPGLGNEWRELKRQERERGDQGAHGQSSHHNVIRDSIDHGTFTTTRKHRKSNTSDIASAYLSKTVKHHRSEFDISEAVDNLQPPTDADDDDPQPQAHGAQNRLKQLGDSVVHRGNTVIHRGNTIIHKGLDAHKRIVKPRMRLEERKKRAKYGDMDSGLRDAGHINDSKYDTLGQPRRASSGSDSREHGDRGLHSNNVSETSVEPEPSTRRSYLHRRQIRSDQQQDGQVYRRRDKVTDSRDVEDDNHNRKSTSFENLATQLSSGARYRHQSHPAQGHRRDSGNGNHHQSFAGHETFTYRDTGSRYRDNSSSSYYEDNHSTMSGMSREIVFESGPHGKGPAALPVLDAEGRYASGSDLEREQSRKINRAGLKMSKSVRHAVGASEPVVPGTMPAMMEDNTIITSNVDDAGLDSEQERTAHRADKAGLRMSNSVRHIVGADGPTSFSLAPPKQNPPATSRYPSQMSTDQSSYSGSLITPSGAGVAGTPTEPRAMREYDSYRPRRSDAPSPSSSLARNNQFRSQRYRSFQYSGGQASSEDESVRHGPAPSNTQPYYYASAPALSMTEEEKIRKQSFSASKISLFEKLQNARPESHDRVMQIYEGTSSAAVPASTSMRDGEPSEVGEVSDEPSQLAPRTAIEGSSVAPNKASRTGKGRVDEPPREDALKRRKLSEDEDEVDVAAGAKAATASFFGTAGGEAMQSVESESEIPEAASIDSPAALRPFGRPMQSLREKFSLPTPDRSSSEKGSPPVYPNSFRRQRREEAVKNVMDLVLTEEQEVHPPTITNEKVAKETEIPALLVAPQAFSTDGARSRINTVSALKVSVLSAVSEANGSESDVGTRMPVTANAKSREETAEKPKESEFAIKRQKLLQQLRFDDDHGSKVAASRVRAEGLFPHERRLAPQKNAPSVATKLKSPEPAVAPRNPPQRDLLSKRTAKCVLCGQVVFGGSMQAHQKRCAEERAKETITKEMEEEKEKRRARKEKIRARKEKSDALVRKHLAAHGFEDEVSMDEAPPRPVSRTKLRLSERISEKMAGKPAAVGAGRGDAEKEDAQHVASAAPEAPARDPVKEPSNTVTAKRSAVLAMAARFQQPPPGAHSPATKVTPRKITTNVTAFAAPKEKVSDLGGTDGAASTSHVVRNTRPHAEEMPIELSMWLAEKFGMEVQDLGEVRIEVGAKEKRKTLTFAGWKTG